MNNPDELGELDPAVAAELEQAVVGHRLDHVELEAAIGYRDAVIFRAAAVMRSHSCPEPRIAAMAADARATPLANWVRALRAPADFGPWDD